MHAEAISRNKSYVIGARLPFVSASVLPAILGSVWCWVYAPEFHLTHAILGILGVLFLHLGANTINDYFDWDESDRINKFPTPFSGGSRSHVENALKRNTFLTMSVLFFAIAFIAGWVLFAMGRPQVLLIGTIGGLCGLLYSLQPVSLQSRGVGETVIFFAFGPLITLGIGYVITGVFEPGLFLIGVPNGFIVANILWINEFPDYEADRDVGKRNLVVKLGTYRARYGYVALDSLFFISVLALIILKIYPLWSLLVLFLAPFAVRSVKLMWKYHSEPRAIVPAQAGTIQFQMFSALLVTLSFIIDKVI